MIGGLVNAFLVDGGLIMPRLLELADGRKIWQPGWLGNVGVGGITALVLWGLYGPLANIPVMSVGGASPEPTTTVLRLSQIVGSVLSGIGGSRVLTSELEKQFLKSAKTDLLGAIEDLEEDRRERR